MEYTNLEQGSVLIGLGLKIETSDFVWCRDNDKSEDWKLCIKDWNVNTDIFSFRNGLVRPAWSAEALLKEIPDCIRIGDAYFSFMLLRKDGYWYAAYRDNLFNQPKYNGNYTSLLDMLVDVLRWLLENKYKNND